jgi:hypothetical protein
MGDQKGIPALILIAHALSPDNLIRSIKEGAQSYVPKDELSELPAFVSDILGTSHKMTEKRGHCFLRLKPFLTNALAKDGEKKTRKSGEVSTRITASPRKTLKISCDLSVAPKQNRP